MRVGGRHRLFLRNKITIVGNYLRIGPPYRLLRRNRRRPRELETRPQQVVHPSTFALARKPRTCQLPHVKQRAKESSKKHDLRKNKPKHAQDVALVNLPTVQTGDVLFNNRPKPTGERQNEKNQPSCQHPT